jgi:hypothetical protein
MVGGCPLAVGRTNGGLPVGVQVVALCLRESPSYEYLKDSEYLMKV